MDVCYCIFEIDFVDRVGPSSEVEVNSGNAAISTFRNLAE